MNHTADRDFARTVYNFHKRQGRHDLPWRQTTDPYRILVSEMMLQQTQVARVIPKYQAFLKLFPNVAALAEAPLSAVLRIWQGLGYNRRAKLLHQCARVVANDLNGVFPKTLEGLVVLPGIGPYTGSAVMAFAYDAPVVVIETNIRTVYLHHFFAGRNKVSDRELLPIIERTLDRQRPRLWYSALMDYGTHLKATLGNQNYRSRHYTKQSKFEGSDRQIRGAILRALVDKPHSRAILLKTLKDFPVERITVQIEVLARERLIEVDGRWYRLPEA